MARVRVIVHGVFRAVAKALVRGMGRTVRIHNIEVPTLRLLRHQ